jgi:hypothetical protein
MPNQNAARLGRGRMEFGYEIIRLWERPAEALLASGPGSLPLALLGRLPEGLSIDEGMAQVLSRVAERLEREALPSPRPVSRSTCRARV